MPAPKWAGLQILNKYYNNKLTSVKAIHLRSQNIPMHSRPKSPFVNGYGAIIQARIKAQKRYTAGFTLIEVLCAVVLLSVGILAVMTANQAARETQQRAVYIAAARNIAQSKIDYLRSISVDSLSSQNVTTQDSSLPKGNNIQVSITGYPTSTEKNMYKATVTVTWPEGKGTRKVSYETLISRNY